MDKSKYIELIRKRLEANFEIETPAVEDGETFLMIARHHNVSGRIFITKKDIIDKYETFETCYMKELQSSSLKEIKNFFQLMAKKAADLQPEKDHFYTDITGILVGSAIPPGTESLLKNLKFEKSFRLFWRGFSKVRIVCVDLTDGTVYTNKMGKEIKKVYQR